VQAANVGLVKAVRGFDPARGHEFLSYAVPVISGEVRRHFRDYSWAVRPPRALQQLQQQIAVTVPRLSQELARTPRSADVARALGVDVHDVLEALGADGCFTPASLDVRSGQGEGAPIGELLVSEGNPTATSDDRTVVVPALRRLAPRDQRILVLRYYCGLTQTEIAREVGISQMQVSRVLSRALDALRPQVV
jgi:RNA polymerase sigma-B factor